MCKRVKKGECKALVFQLKIRADVNCKLCTALSELFMSRGKQPSCTSRQTGFCQNCTQFAVSISIDKKLYDQSGALHSPLFAILHHKRIESKTYVFYLFFFSLHLQNRKEGPHKISFSETWLCL